MAQRRVPPMHRVAHWAPVIAVILVPPVVGGNTTTAKGPVFLMPSVGVLSSKLKRYLHKEGDHVARLACDLLYVARGQG